MGSVAIIPAASDPVHARRNPYNTMLSVPSAAVSDPAFRPSHQHQHQPPQHPLPPHQPHSSSSTSSTSTSTDSLADSPPFAPPSQNAPAAAQPSAPHITSSAPMTSLHDPRRLPDRQRSAYSHHPPQHAQGFDLAGFPLSSTPSGLNSDSSASPRLLPTFRSSRSLGGSEATSPSRIQVHDLSHIRSFANEEVLASSRRLQNPDNRFQDAGRQYEISSMPVTDIIEMVAGLLTKITTTNDQQHEHVHRNIPPPDGASGISPQTTSVLAFHGKNVPSITIHSYLSRIHKYCPTTYEVFLSLLVYFDRMTEMVNKGFIQSLQQRSDQHRNGLGPHPSSSPSTPSALAPNHPSTRGSIVTPPSSTRVRARDTGPPSPSPPSNMSPDTVPPSLGTRDPDQEDALSLSHYFVVDSFNIHRLVIAGVTCASKFFSDVFYTNSRYAKVGGLPLLELNHLELQFLLLNDFRLAVPVEELEAYGTMLVEFYAREVVAQQQQQQSPQQEPLDSFNSATDTTESYMPHSGRRGSVMETDVSQTPTPP